VGACFDTARTRSQPRKIAPPDAMQLACAATAGVDLFLTSPASAELMGFTITSVDRAAL
jgi:hypothetical protein